MRMCQHCNEIIEGKTSIRGLHNECAVRLTVGSVAHQTKTCSCYGGDSEDDPTLSKREAALAAYRLALGKD